MEFAVGTAVRGLVEDVDHQVDFIDRSGQMGPEQSYLLASEEYDARRAIYHPFKLNYIDVKAFSEQCIYCSIESMMKKYADLLPTIDSK